MHTFFLASALSALVSAPLMAQDATVDTQPPYVERPDLVVWMVVFKLYHRDAAATVSPVLMTGNACQLTINAVMAKGGNPRLAICVNTQTGEVLVGEG